jgi:uncharacterized protein YggE
MRFVPMVLLMLVLVPGIALAQKVMNEGSLRTISVTGAADVKVTPDRVVLTLGIWSRGAVLADTKADNETRTRKVLAFLRGAGLRPEQIRTDYLAINPNFDWGATARRYTYDMRRNVVVTLSNVAQFESILSGVVANGVDNVMSVKFLTSQLKKYREQARGLAIHAAREKAEKLCAELGVNVGAVQTIQEDRSGEESGWNWWSWYWGGASGRGMSQIQISAPSEAPGGESFETLALGELPISASVRVTFLVE